MTYSFIKYMALFFLSLLMWQNGLAQSGWTRAMDGYFAQVAVSSFGSNKFYDEQGAEQELTNKFSSENILLYAEYGVNDRLTMLLNVAVGKFQRYDHTETAIGPGDLRVGFKYGLLNKKWPVSISLEAEIPTASDEKLVAYKDGSVTDELLNLPTSDNEYNYWLTLAASRSNAKGNMYASLFSAINVRTKGYSNQLQAGAEIGKRFGKGIWLIGKLGIQEKLGDNEFLGSVFLFGEQTTYTTYGLTSFFKFSKTMSFTASYQNFSGLLVDLNNVSVGSSFIFGIAIEH